jgi:hypothetical protein
VSLAPVSYFFCALAAVAAIAATVAIAVKATRLRIRAVIVLSPIGNFFSAICFAGVSQAEAGLASIGLFRGMKQDCCAPSIMIDA